MEPVEIDIRMKQNVTEEGKKVTGAVGEMDDATKKMQAQVVAMLEERKKMVADIEKNLGKTAENISKTSNSLSGDVDKLKQASDILGDSLEDAKNQIAEIEATLSSGTATIDDYAKANEQLNQVGGELTDILTKSNDLQDISNDLMNLGKGNVEKLTRSKLLLAKANQWVAKTFKMSEVAAKRFTAVASFGLTIAISALITLYHRYREKQEEAKQAAEELIQIEKEKRKEIADSYASEQAKIESMRTALNSENVSRNDKLNIIKKLKAQIPGYNAELDTEGRLIRENKASIDQYLVSLEKSLKLRAAEKELMEIYSEKMRIETSPEAMKEKAAIEAWNKLTGGKEQTLSYDSRYSLNKQTKTIAGTKTYQNDELDKLAKKEEQIKNYISSGGLIELTKPSTGSSAGSKAAKAAKEEYNAQAELADRLTELRKRTTALEIDIMQEGLQKKLAQIDNEEKEELARIEAHQKKILDIYNKENKTDIKDIKNIPGIDPKTLQEIENEKLKIINSAEEKRKQATEANAREIANLTRKYASEEVRIRYDYQQDIEKLEKAGQTEAANLARIERDKRISELTAEMIESSSLYKLAIDEKLLASKKATEALISDTKKRIEALVVENKLTREAADKMIGDLDKTQVSRENSKNENNPFAKLLKGLKDYKAAKKDLDDKRNSVTPDELVKLEDAANKTLKTTAEAAAVSLAGVQEIIGSVVGALDHLGLLTEEEKKDAEDIIGMVGGAADIAMGIASGNPVQILTGAVNLLASAFSYFDFKSKKIAKQQKEHKKNLDELSLAYTNLQREVDKALGTDVYDKQKQAIANLRKQIAENERLIALEYQKKKKKRDQDAIAGWKAEIEALKGEMDDIVTSITEDLAQTNAKDLARTLADALVNAARTGEDAFTAMGDVINDVLRNAVVNALSKKFLEKQMDEATEYLAGAMGDGELSDYEKRRFEEMIKNAGTQFNVAMNAYSDLFGSQEGASRRSAAKGIAQASQDSIDELSGTITFMAGEFRTANVLAATRTQTGKDMLLVTRTILSVLNVIAENTSYNKRLEDIAEGIEKMNRDGVNIKK